MSCRIQYWETLLFLIFINDIADDMLGLGRLFADDTSIGHTAHDENTLKNMISSQPLTA
jgi:hypothetical protein